mgnify:CR=1 FL=1
MPASAPPSVSSEKHCNACGRLLPSVVFRRVFRDRDWPRHSECNPCRNRRDRERRDQERVARQNRALARLLRLDNPRKAEATVSAVIAECGGFDNFVKALGELLTGKSGTPNARLRAYGGLLNLITAADESKRMQEAIDSRRRLELSQMARDDAVQEVAEEILREAGWTVLPPGGSQLSP